MFLKENLEKFVKLECEPEPKMNWKIRALNFSDLEQIDSECGLFPVYGATVAQLLKTKGENLRLLSEDERKALQAVSSWTQARNTFISLLGVVGCNDELFENPEKVKDYFLKLRPLSSVRDVIDELSRKILEFSDMREESDEKKTSL